MKRVCAECNKIECFEECPICKTEKTILRIKEKNMFFYFPKENIL